MSQNKPAFVESGPMPATGSHGAPQQLSLFDALALAVSAAAQPSAATPSRVRPVDVAPIPTALPAAPPPAAPRFQHPRAQRSIALGEHQVGYAFRRARRRSIGFVVGLDGLSVSAPRWVAVSEVEQALQAKAGWILRKLHEQHERAQRLQAAKVV